MDAITRLDGNLLIGIQQALNADWLTPIMKFITMFGEGGIFWIVLCIALLMFRRTRRLGIVCSLSLLLTFICCNLIIKPTVDRIRPWVVFEAVHAYLPPPGDASFPSGHSANSMAPAWGMFVATLPGKVKTERAGGGIGFERDYSLTPCLGWRGDGASARQTHLISIFLVVLALMIGLSRLYLGMHYPTDVLCGLLLGMACASIVFTAISRYEMRNGMIGGSERRADG